MTPDAEFRALVVARMATEILRPMPRPWTMEDIRLSVETARIIVGEAIKQETTKTYRELMSEAEEING